MNSSSKAREDRSKGSEASELADLSKDKSDQIKKQIDKRLNDAEKRLSISIAWGYGFNTL